jgi:hypothetical protein
MQSMRVETYVCPAQRCLDSERGLSFALPAVWGADVGAVAGEFDRAGFEPLERRLAAHVIEVTIMYERT